MNLPLVVVVSERDLLNSLPLELRETAETSGGSYRTFPLITPPPQPDGP